ncbi:MAG: hypothetical protein ACRD4R_05365 [Candidatus Acidiferrales bacterium]
MKNAPDVLFTPTSKLKKRLEAIDWQDITLGPLNIAQLIEDATRPHVLVLDSREAHTVWTGIEERALDAPLYPVVVTDDDHIKEDASALLRLAPALKEPVDSLIQTTARMLLQRAGSLYRELASVDSETELLTQNSQCEWNRCSVGIVGIVRVPHDSSPATLPDRLELLRSNAYAAIDRVPIARLSTDDLWTLLLVLAVPWTRTELVTRKAESSILRAFEGDTTGSRKLVMSSDESIRALLGPVAGTGSIWYPTSDDPLRDRLHALVKSPEELEALQVLFNKRLSGDDFDRLVTVLGRKP